MIEDLGEIDAAVRAWGNAMGCCPQKHRIWRLRPDRVMVCAYCKAVIPKEELDLMARLLEEDRPKTPQALTKSR